MRNQFVLLFCPHVGCVSQYPRKRQKNRGDQAAINAGNEQIAESERVEESKGVLTSWSYNKATSRGPRWNYRRSLVYYTLGDSRGESLPENV